MTKPNPDDRETQIIPNSASDPIARQAAEDAIGQRIEALTAQRLELVDEHNALGDAGAENEDERVQSLRNRVYALEDEIEGLQQELELGIQADLQAARRNAPD